MTDPTSLVPKLGITLILNVVVPLIILGAIAFVVYTIINKNKDQSLDGSKLAMIFGAAFLIVFLPIVGFGVFRGWYMSTGYNEVNHPYPKAQEAAYAYKPFGSINNRGLESNASTRKNARSLKNPVPATAESISKGKDLFLTYCKPCHGRDGGGQGVMGSVPMLRLSPVYKEDPQSLQTYLSGFTGSKPDFDIQFVQHRSEGDIYYTISNGGEAIMPSFRDAMWPEERWSLVNYIKRELGKPNATN